MSKEKFGFEGKVYELVNADKFLSADCHLCAAWSRPLLCEMLPRECIKGGYWELTNEPS